MPSETGQNDNAYRLWVGTDVVCACADLLDDTLAVNHKRGAVWQDEMSMPTAMLTHTSSSYGIALPAASSSTP